MKWFIAILGLCIAGLLIVPIFYQQKDTSISTPTIEELQWVDYTPTPASFKIALPSDPQRASDNIKDSKYQIIKHFEMYVSSHPDGTLYMINTISYPEKTLKEEIGKKGEEGVLMDAMNTMLSANSKNRLKQVSVVDFQNRKSIDFSMENDQKTVFAKSFLAGNTLYVLAEVGDIRDLPKKDFDHFIQSFQILNENQTPKDL